MTRRPCRWLGLLGLLVCAACGGGPGPTAPSATGSQSFLLGTWKVTVTIQVNPGEPGAPPATSGPTTWTFDVVPQTNDQAFRATVQSAHAWLPVTIVATTAVVPGNTPPAHISTQGDDSSPRGCRGTLGSFGTRRPRGLMRISPQWIVVPRSPGGSCSRNSTRSLC